MLHDLPITKGLQQRKKKKEKLDDVTALEPLLADIAAIPPAPRKKKRRGRRRASRRWTGGLKIAISRTFRIVTPTRSNRMSAEGELVFAVFNLLL